MADGIRLTVTDAEILATLDRVDRVAADPGAIMSDIAGYMVTATQRHIERERGPDGGWPRLSPRTAAKRIGRRRRGYANMLRVTGRLYASIVGEATSTEAIVGTNAVQAAILQLGGTIKMQPREQDIHLARTNRGWRFARAAAKRKVTRRVKVGAHSVTIPAREYLYVDRLDRDEIGRIAAEGFRRETGLPGGAP